MDGSNNSFLPNEAEREDRLQSLRRAALANAGGLCVRRELADGSRTVVENRTLAGGGAYWAAWLFETLLLPKNACPALPI